MLNPISVNQFADMVMKNNKGYKRKDLIRSLNAALKAKKNGAGCMVCGAPIWAAGSAITGTSICALPAPQARRMTATIMRSNKLAMASVRSATASFHIF